MDQVNPSQGRHFAPAIILESTKKPGCPGGAPTWDDIAPRDGTNSGAGSRRNFRSDNMPQGAPRAMKIVYHPACGSIKVGLYLVSRAWRSDRSGCCRHSAVWYPATAGKHVSQSRLAIAHPTPVIR